MVDRAQGELRPRTRENYEWRLRKHLLPFFADYPVSELDVALAARYREEKVLERERIIAAAAAGQPLRDKRGQRRMPLSNDTIDKALVTLTQVLDSAVERGLVVSNPARGKRRRLNAAKPVRRQLEVEVIAQEARLVALAITHLLADRESVTFAELPRRASSPTRSCGTTLPDHRGGLPSSAVTGSPGASQPRARACWRSWRWWRPGPACA